MKKTNQIIPLLLAVYVIAILVLYFWMIYPALVKPRGLIQTKIPSLSVSGMKEVDKLFSDNEKVWIGYPSRPDLSKFSFGQTDPI